MGKSRQDRIAEAEALKSGFLTNVYRELYGERPKAPKPEEYDRGEAGYVEQASKDAEGPE